MEQDKLKPYVVVDRHQSTGILLVRGRKFIRMIARDPHFRIVRVPLHVFDEDYRPLTHYSNGMPNGVPYDLQTAARKYLEYGKNAGITEGAMRCLQDIVNGGNISMESVEQAQKQNDTTTEIPKLEKLSDALQGVTKKASTKNGTTADAKKPSKAKVEKRANGASPAANGNTDQENSMKTATHTASKSKPSGAVVAKSVKNGKVAGAKKAPASKKAPAGKKAPAAKKPASKKAATSEGRGRAPSISDDAVVTYVADNPKREGTEAFRKFAVYKVGMRIGDIVKKNVDRADVNYNLKRGFIKVKGA